MQMQTKTMIKPHRYPPSTVPVALYYSFKNSSATVL